jgi:hydroxymethylpyrimidine pyrophosphatase-like HAD family hydrolase
MRNNNCFFQKIIVIFLVQALLCVYLSPAVAGPFFPDYDTLSPIIKINFNLFRFDFNNAIVQNSPDFSLPESTLHLRQLYDADARDRELEKIQQLYDRLITELVENNTNRMLWHLKDAVELCSRWMKIKDVCQGQGMFMDKELDLFFHDIADYDKKIRNCMEHIAQGRTRQYLSSWPVQRVDPATGEFLKTGEIMTDDIRRIVNSENSDMVLQELVDMGIIEVIEDKAMIATDVIDRIREPRELVLSAGIRERTRLFSELRKRAYGVPVSFARAHQEGRWHAAVQVLIMDSQGNVLVEPRSDRGGVEIDGTVLQLGNIGGGLITTELAVTGHLKQGEEYRQAACRIIRNRLETKIQEGQLYELSDLPYGQRKMGDQNYASDSVNYENGSMRFLSRDYYNNEFCQSFVYILDDRQRAELEPQLDGRPRTDFIPLESIVKWVNSDKLITPSTYRSAFMLMFHHKENLRAICEHTHAMLVGILHQVISDPAAGNYNVDAVTKFAESVISMRWDIESTLGDKADGNDEYKYQRQKAQALQELSFAAKTARILCRWHKIKTLLASMEREYFLNLNATRIFFDELNSLGVERNDTVSRALICLLAKKDTSLEWQEPEQRFVFCHKGEVLSGIYVDGNGKFILADQKIAAGISEIQRGAIASDMDLVLAIRDKNIDREILKFFNQLRIAGLVMAVISANEFRKQFGRSLAELINENLLDDFYIYANGAGIKAKWDSGKIGKTAWGGEVRGNFIDDKTYGGTFSDQQIDFFDTRIETVLSVWEAVIETIRANRKLLDDQANIPNLTVKLQTMLGRFKSQPELRIGEELSNSAADIVTDFYEVLHSSGKDKKFQEYQKAVKDQLDPEKTKDELKSKKKWPFVDRRFSLDGKELVQVTLKPIYPASKYLYSDRPSSREIIGKIIGGMIREFNEMAGEDVSSDYDYAPLLMKEGGGTSIDIMRKDINKARAARDLIKSLHLEDSRDLILAMDDEMASNAVGFPFLTVEGITVLSMEHTKEDKERKYSQQEKEKIKASLLWAQACGIGVEIEATKKVFSLLLNICERDMWEVVSGENKKPLPAIRRLKELLLEKKIESLLPDKASVPVVQDSFYPKLDYLQVVEKAI